MLKLLPCAFILANLASSNALDPLDYPKASQAIGSISKTLNYIHDHPSHLNVDGLFGMTIAIANLRVLRNQGIEYPFIEVLQILMEDLFHRLYVNITAEGYDKLIKQTMLLPDVWETEINFKTNEFLGDDFKILSDNLFGFRRLISSDDLSESLSDKCIVELLPDKHFFPRFWTNLKNKVIKKRNCKVTFECAMEMMSLNPSNSAYGTTHKLLYLLIGRQLGCKYEAKQFNNKVKTYCKRIYGEAKTSASYSFPPWYNDLLLEQITLCSFVGFADFFNEDFMKNVFAMQSEEGCFNKWWKSNKRRKRKSNLDENFCVDHTNGLGIATLSMYLRYLFA